MAKVKYSATESNRIKGWSALFTPSFVISMIILLIILTAVLLAPAVAPYNPNKLDLSQALLPSSLKHLLGTDKQGRDLFSRILFGGRTTLLAAMGVTAIAVTIGVPLGLLCGYFGGIFDTIVMRLWDINLAFPTLLLAFVFVACFGRNITNAVIALGIIYLPMSTRFARSLAIVEKNKTYVEAARSIGYSNKRILFRHIFPNCLQSIVVQLTMMIASAILDLAALSFLGLGVQPPTADWGQMLQEGQEYLLISPVLALAPGFAIILTIVSINIFSDGLQMYWDPMQRKIPSSVSRSIRRYQRFSVGIPGLIRRLVVPEKAEVQNG